MKDLRKSFDRWYDPNKTYNIKETEDEFHVKVKKEKPVSDKMPKWFEQWSKTVFEPRLDNIEKRLDVIEDKLERNNIK